jgi:hypothetical protein
MQPIAENVDQMKYAAIHLTSVARVAFCQVGNSPKIAIPPARGDGLRPSSEIIPKAVSNAQ